jgi:hypothetical protein
MLAGIARLKGKLRPTARHAALSSERLLAMNLISGVVGHHSSDEHG